MDIHKIASPDRFGITGLQISLVAQEMLLEMLNVAHASAPLSPVAVSVLGDNEDLLMAIRDLRGAMHDGRLTRLSQEIAGWHGISLSFSVSCDLVFYRGICGGFIWGQYDDMPDCVLTLFYSWNVRGRRPPFSNQHEPGLSVLDTRSAAGSVW